MIESDAFVQALQDIGVDFFTGVPDSILGGIIAELMERQLYTPAVREDEAVAMAAGAYMSGKVPAVLMQNSGEPRQLVAEDDDLRDVAIGDVDADGRADFIAAVDDTPSLRLRAGLPGGALGPSQPLDLGVAVGRLFADDSDHDGDADLLLVGTTAAGGVRWAQATGGFSFAAGPVTTLPFAPVAADAADVDGDGDLDLLLAGGDPMQLLVLLHDGAGGFSSLAAVGLHGAAVDVAAGDFDGTGYRDAAVLNAAGRVDVVRLASTGAVGTSSSAAGQAALHLAAGDVDGDGLTDVVTTAFLGDGKPATPIWFRGLGTGELAPGVPSTDKNLNSANDVAIVDFAGDGLPEVVVTRDGGVYRTGLARPVGGSLVLAEAYVQPADTSRALAADMDGDALVDLLLWGQYDTLLLLSRLGPWEALGHSLTGSAGLSRLVGEGSLLPGSIVRLTLEGASPVAPATLVLSTSASFTPFKGGVLVPTAQFVVPGLFTDASGALALQGDWPAGVPAGTQLVAQVWMLDALGPQGASASNGVRATAP